MVAKPGEHLENTLSCPDPASEHLEAGVKFPSTATMVDLASISAGLMGAKEGLKCAGCINLRSFTKEVLQGSGQSTQPLHPLLA